MPAKSSPALSAGEPSENEVRGAVSYMLGTLKGCTLINIVQGDPGRYILRFQLDAKYKGGYEALQEDIITMLEPIAPAVRPYQFGADIVVAAVESQDVKKLASTGNAKKQ